MSAAELKSNLHKYIVESDDLAVLQQVKALFEQLSQAADGESTLSPKEERMLQIGIDQADKGALIPNEEVRAEINQWIKAKRK